MQKGETMGCARKSKKKEQNFNFIFIPQAWKENVLLGILEKFRSVISYHPCWAYNSGWPAWTNNNRILQSKWLWCCASSQCTENQCLWTQFHANYWEVKKNWDIVYILILALYDDSITHRYEILAHCKMVVLIVTLLLPMKLSRSERKQNVFSFYCVLTLILTRNWKNDSANLASLIVYRY